MSQTTQTDIITLGDVATRLPNFITKVPHILNGLKQAYLRTPTSPAGLGIAFEKVVKRNPQGIALLFEDQSYSYQALNEWANQIAHYYLSIGAKKGDVVAVMVENRPELIASIVALAKIGVTIALVNTSQVGKVLAHSINLVNPIAVIAGEEVRAAIDETRADLNVAPDRFHWFADQETRKNSGTAPQGYINLAQQIDQFPKFNPSTTRTVTGKDGLFYIYTSGTTGLPKAVIF
ncbi:MAG: AMP-binding protein, partial [Pseudomonadota bacterium]|nr:AMP-binding protein [Pseudomonadota bacterium]